MRINIINRELSKNIGFKSKRTDKNTLSVLSTGTNPISLNKTQNILQVLGNYSQTSDKKNLHRFSQKSLI